MSKEKNSLMRIYRFMHKMHKNKIPFLPQLLMRYIRVIYSCDLPPSVIIGENSLFVHNGLGCVIHPDVVIGNNTQIYQNVSIAGRNNRGVPIIGNNVFIGAGACVLGGIIIGHGSSIGANSVVIKDVEQNLTVGGIPATVIVKKVWGQ